MAGRKPKISPETTPVTRVIEDEGAAQLLVQTARLEVVRGPDKGLVREMEELHLVVGGSPECDLVLTDKAVSRRHLELQPTDHGFLLVDLESRNGTFVNGLRIERAMLGGGEEIHLGRSVIRFELTGTEEFPLSTRKFFGAMLGQSPVMRRVFAVLERVAATDTTLLLEGETGTGKDLAAECVHLASRRHEKPFVVVDCGAMTSTLVASELFGHVKGAFTGAERDRPGAFEAAEGGTVFLDEIGELDASLQPNLLRVLERKELRRLGENHYRKVDVRIVAASNRDLSSDVTAGRFRQDLFYRLSVCRVRLPALRDRREDILQLARVFIQHLKPEMEPAALLTPSVMALLVNHDWPGNVRELRNVIERLLLFPDSPRSAFGEDRGLIDHRRLPTDLGNITYADFKRSILDPLEKTYLTAILDSCRGVVSKAARRARLPRQSFYRLVERHDLKQKS